MGSFFQNSNKFRIGRKTLRNRFDVPFVFGPMNKGGNSTAVLTSSASNVDGLFHVLLTFNSPTSNISVSNFSVTNGSAEYLMTSDNITYRLMVMPNAGGNVSIQLLAGTGFSASNILTVTVDPSYQFLQNSGTSNIYYDFRETIGVASDTLEANDPGLKDISGNSRNATILGSPLISAATPGITRFRDLTTAAISTGNNGSSFLNDNFSVVFKCGSTDGQQSSNWDICGNYDGTNIGLIITINTAGRLQIQYQGFTWLSTAAVFANGAVSDAQFDIHFNFTTDTLTVNKDGSNVAGSFTVSNISAVNPASYACTANIYVGAYNNNGTTTSNPSTSYIYYFAITDLQTSNISAIRTYLNAKKPFLELVSTLTDANYLKNPHDVIISDDGTKAYVSGKGNPSLTTVDGSFAIVDLSTPTLPTVLGGYYGAGDQKDGETVLELSSTRVLHFVDTQVLLFNVSNPASPSLVRTVSHATGSTPDVVNGAVQIGNYVFGANKSGYITVLDVSDIDNFTLVGNKDMDALAGFVGPHDVDIAADGESLVFCSRRGGNETAAQFGIVKVMNSGSLIPLASWVMTSTITSNAAPNLSSSNRIRVFDGNIAVLHTLQNTGKNIVTYDISNLSSPVYKGAFSLAPNAWNASAGACIYRGKIDIAANDIGIRLLDVTTDPVNINQLAGYFNSTNFTVGTNTNFHDIEWFIVNNQNYCIVTCQNNGIAIFKINRI